MKATLDLSIQTSDAPLVRILLGELRADLSHRYAVGRTVAAGEYASLAGVFIVARYNGRLAGCGAVEDAGERAARIEHLFVRESLRGLGVGEALMSELERTAAFHGSQTISVRLGGRQPEVMFLARRRGYVIQTVVSAAPDESRFLCFTKDLKARAHPCSSSLPRRDRRAEPL